MSDKVVVDAAKAEVGAEASEAKRALDIITLCKNGGIEDRAGDFIGSTLSVDQIKGRIEALVATRGKSQPASDAIEDIPDKDRRRYSYHAAIRKSVAAMEGKGAFNGVEAEIHRELEIKWPTGTARKGTLLVPIDLRTEDERMQMAYGRTMTSIGVTKGTETVFQQYGQLIDLLRNRARVISSGATVMPNLSGPVGFPKLTGGPAVEWASEDPAAATTASDLAWGMAQLSGKTLRGLVGFTRQFLGQSSVDVEGTTRNELAFGHSLAIDKGAIHGKGSAGEPVGIYRMAGVNSEPVSGAPLYADLVNTVTAVFADNSDVDNMGWITTPEMAGKLAQTQRFTGTDTPLWVGNFSNGSVLGYKATTTNQVNKVMTGLIADVAGSETGIVFGNWEDLLVGLFGALDLLLDPYTGADKQIIKVHSYQLCDIVAKHAESFCVTTGATP